MTLYLIGLGLHDQKDITIKGFEIVKKCDIIYLENYTSILQCSLAELEKFYGKKIILANRDTTEQGTDKILKEAKTKDVAFLVVGDPMSATTHVEIFKEAKEKNINVEIINNASVLTAIGITGLQLYKFGRITSIPFAEDVPNLETPYNILRENQYMNLHSLFLLDLHPENNKFMTINQALDILEKIEEQKKDKIVKQNMIVVGCARLGSKDAIIKSCPWKQIRKFDFGAPPHCLIVPAPKLHFLEEEMLKFWSVVVSNNN